MAFIAPELKDKKQGFVAPELRNNGFVAPELKEEKRNPINQFGRSVAMGYEQFAQTSAAGLARQAGLAAETAKRLDNFVDYANIQGATEQRLENLRQQESRLIDAITVSPDEQSTMGEVGGLPAYVRGGVSLNPFTREQLGDVQGKITQAESILNFVQSDKAKAFDESFLAAYGETANDVADFFTELAGDAAGRYGVEPEFAQSLAGQVAVGLGQLPGFVALFATGPGGLVAVESVMFNEASSQYRDLVPEDQRTPEGELAFGLAYSTAATALERTGLETMTGRLFGGKMKEFTAKEILKRLANIELRSDIEGLTELTQGLLLDGMAKGTINPDQKLFTEDRLREFLVGKLVAAPVATITSGPETTSMEVIDKEVEAQRTQAREEREAEAKKAKIETEAVTTLLGLEEAGVQTEPLLMDLAERTAEEARLEVEAEDQRVFGGKGGERLRETVGEATRLKTSKEIADEKTTPKLPFISEESKVQRERGSQARMLGQTLFTPSSEEPMIGAVMSAQDRADALLAPVEPPPTMISLDGISFAEDIERIKSIVDADRQADQAELEALQSQTELQPVGPQISPIGQAIRGDIEFIEEAKSKGDPIPATMVEEILVQPPAGYKKRGDQYVYEPVKAPIGSLKGLESPPKGKIAVKEESALEEAPIEFIGYQENPLGELIPQWNLTRDIGGKKKGSTLGPKSLQQLGITPPTMLPAETQTRRKGPSKQDQEYAKAIESGDTAKAQKMVDEIAEKLGYTRSRHATGAQPFTVFDRTKISKNDPDTNIQGFHFSSEAGPTASYAYQDSSKNRVLDVYIKKGRTIGRRDAERMVAKGESEDGFPLGYDTVVFREPAGSPTDAQREAYNRGESVALPNGYSVIKNERDGGADLFRSNPDDVITGYLNLDDAFKAHREEHLVVRDPNQIKSADPATYDDEGNLIPISERFPQDQPDIRGNVDFFQKAVEWADEQINDQYKQGIVPQSPNLNLTFAYVIKGAELIKRGVTKFSEWSKEMVSRYGEGIKGYLAEIYKAAKDEGVVSALQEALPVLKREKLPSGYEKLKTHKPNAIQKGIELMGERIQKHSPRVKTELLRLEHAATTELRQWEKILGELSQSLNKAIPRRVRKEAGLNRAFLNGDYDKIKMLINDNPDQDVRNEALKKLDDYRALLQRIAEEAQAAGYEFAIIENYSPRRVKDYKKYALKIAERAGNPELAEQLTSIFERAWREEARASYGHSDSALLSDEEKAAVVNTIVGQGNIRFGEGKPSNFKERKIFTVDEDLESLYETWDDAASKYFKQLSWNINLRRFLGKQVEKPKLRKRKIQDGEPDEGTGVVERKEIRWREDYTQEQKDQIFESVGNYITQLRDMGLFSDRQAEQLVRDVSDYIRYRNVGAKKLSRFISDAQTVSLLANFESALLNFADIAPVGARQGFRNTIKSGLGRAFREVQSLWDKNKNNPDFIKNSLGLESTFDEFAPDGRKIRRWSVDFPLKVVLFRLIDIFGGNTAITAALNKAKKTVKNQESRDFQRWYEQQVERFGAEGAEQLTKDLEAMPDNILDVDPLTLSEDTNLYMLWELSSTRPVTALDYPSTYLKNPSFRFMYGMKSWMLKHLANLNREGIRNMRQGLKEGDISKTAEGASNFIRIAVGTGIAVGSLNIMKEYLRETVAAAIEDREPDYEGVPWLDNAVEGMLSGLGLNRYMAWTLANEGPFSLIVKSISPAAGGMVDNATKDVLDFIETIKLNGVAEEIGEKPIDPYANYVREGRTFRYVPGIGRHIFDVAGRGQLRAKEEVKEEAMERTGVQEFREEETKKKGLVEKNNEILAREILKRSADEPLEDVYKDLINQGNFMRDGRLDMDRLEKVAGIVSKEMTRRKMGDGFSILDNMSSRERAKFYHSQLKERYPTREERKEYLVEQAKAGLLDQRTMEYLREFMVQDPLDQ
jgi:hypothetical protein